MKKYTLISKLTVSLPPLPFPFFSYHFVPCLLVSYLCICSSYLLPSIIILSVHLSSNMFVLVSFYLLSLLPSSINFLSSSSITFLPLAILSPIFFAISITSFCPFSLLISLSFLFTAFCFLQMPIISRFPYLIVLLPTSSFLSTFLYKFTLSSLSYHFHLPASFTPYLLPSATFFFPFSSLELFLHLSFKLFPSLPSLSFSSKPAHDYYLS